MIKPGTIYNDIISHEDWLPTFLAAAGVPDVVEKVKNGYEANGKTWKVHLDGHNYMPFFKGEVAKAPRDQILYFGQGGELNAIRWNDWKVHFAMIEGDIARGQREIPNWPAIINLRADPYEEAWRESAMYMRWYADNMWLFVPIQLEIQKFLASMNGYPFQEGQSLNAGGINYQSLKALKILEQIREKGLIELPRN